MILYFILKSAKISIFKQEKATHFVVHKSSKATEKT